MTTLRITDYNGSILIVDINETPEEFNRRIDEAWNTRKYSIPMGTRFDRVDVRNIALITEVKTPAQPETPVEEPTAPEPEPQPEQPIEDEPEEPTEEEPAPEESTEPTEPEPTEDN